MTRVANSLSTAAITEVCVCMSSLPLKPDRSMTLGKALHLHASDCLQPGSQCPCIVYCFIEPVGA